MGTAAATSRPPPPTRGCAPGQCDVITDGPVEFSHRIAQTTKTSTVSLLTARSMPLDRLNSPPVNYLTVSGPNFPYVVPRATSRAGKQRTAFSCRSACRSRRHGRVVRFKPLHTVCWFQLRDAVHHEDSLSNCFSGGDDFVWRFISHPINVGSSTGDSDVRLVTSIFNFAASACVTSRQAFHCPNEHVNLRIPTLRIQ